MRTFIIASALATLSLSPFAQAPDAVFIEELTWTEVRDAIKAGKTTVILPTGGTEQNGPHMVLGKHNFIIKHTSEQIARKLGNALVAPVVAYVPEGDLDPPSGHMRYPGTRSRDDRQVVSGLRHTPAGRPNGRLGRVQPYTDATVP